MHKDTEQPPALDDFRASAILSRLDGLYTRILADPRPSATGLLTLIQSWRKEALRAEKTFAALQDSLSKARDAADPGADAAARTEELGPQLERARMRICDSEAAFARQNAEISALKNALEAKESELDSWRQKYEDASSQAPETRRRAEAAEKAAGRAEAELERQRSRIEGMSRALAAKESELDSWRQKYEDASSQAPEIRRRAEAAEKAARRAEAELERQRSASGELNDALAAKESDADSWRRKYEKELSRTAELKGRAADAEEASARAGEELARQRSRIEGLNKALAAGESDADSWRQKYEKELSRTAELKRLAAQAEEASARAGAELDSLRQKSKEHSSRIPELERRAAAAEGAAKQAEAELARQRNEIEEQLQILQDKETEIDSLRRKSEMHSSRIPELERQAAAAEERAAKQAEAEIERQRSRIEHLSGQLERAWMRACDFEAALTRQNEEIEELNKTLADRGSKIERQKSGIEEQIKAFETTESELDSWRQRYEEESSRSPEPKKQAAGTGRTAKRAEAKPGAPAAPAPRQIPAAQDAYARMIRLMRDVGEKGPIVLHDALSLGLSQCLGLLSSNPHPLLALTSRSTAGNYLHGHSVNVSILAMRLAGALRWEKRPILQLGLAAALHESGLLSLSPRPAGSSAADEEDEERERRLHPMDARGMRRHLALIKEWLARSLPQAAMAELPDVELAAHWIGFCDVYEALSHPRPWRKPLIPRQAIKTILKDFAGEFSRKALQPIIEIFTLYPPGSYVQLSSGQIARVIAVKTQTPSLPTVEVRLDPNGKPPSQALILDLEKSPLARIVRAVDATELPIKDETVRAAFEAERWWTQP